MKPTSTLQRVDRDEDEVHLRVELEAGLGRGTDDERGDGGEREVLARAVLVDAVAGDVDRVRVAARVVVVAVAAAEVGGRAVPVAVGQATEEGDRAAAERRVLDGADRGEVVVERARLVHGDGERGEGRERQDERRERREGRERGRGEVGGEGDGDEVRHRAEVELGALQHAEDTEQPSAVAGDVPRRHPRHGEDDDDAARERARRDGVDEPRAPPRARREQAAKRQDERERPGERERTDRDRRERELGADDEGLARGQQAARHVRGHDAPRESGEHCEREQRRGARAGEHRLGAEGREVLLRRPRARRLEEETRGPDEEPEPEGEREQDANLAREHGAERRTVGRVRDGVPRLDPGDERRGDRCAGERGHQPFPARHHPDRLLLTVFRPPVRAHAAAPARARRDGQPMKVRGTS